MLIGKKGQAALEYLMTYSWALVAIAIVVGVLIFMGILNAPITGTCTGLEKLAYEDHTIDSNGTFILYLKNGTGMQIAINSISPGEDFSGSCTPDSNTVNATKDFNVVCTGTGISAGQAYNGKITIEYSRRQARHTESATCTGTAPLTGIFLLASAPQIVEGFFAGAGGNLDLNNPDEMMLGSGGGSYASFGSYTSNPLDANSTMDWAATIYWDENTPVGTDINLQTRTSDNNAVWSPWSGYYTNPSGESITSPNGRFIQYKANLSTTNPSITPELLEVRMHGNPLAQSCGNLKREGTEQCDTNDFGGATCITLGYTSGTLACTGACAFDTNGCVGAVPNQSPFAGLGASAYSANVGTFIAFYGNTSYDPDGNIVNYAWNFGDGNVVASPSNYPLGAKALLHFDEGSGTTTADSSGNGNNGTLVNAPTWTSQGNFGSALQFDGADDYINVGDSSSLDINQGITVAAWVKINSASNYAGIVSKWDWQSNLRSYELGHTNTGKIMFGISKDGTSNGGNYGSYVQLFGNTTITAGQWHYLAGTFDGNALRTYLDGVLDSTSNAWNNSIYVSTVNLNIGRTANYPTYSLNGTIDEVAIYSRALDAGEILALYQGSPAIVNHKYNSAGDYNVALTVTDNNGATDANTIIVNIASGPVSFCPGTKAWTTQSDFASGADVNIDGGPSPGNLVLDLKPAAEIAPDANTKLLLHLNDSQMDDDFESGYDSNRWSDLPSDVNVSNGKLNMYADASGTIYKVMWPDKNISGDFDIQVDFNLIVFPSPPTASVGTSLRTYIDPNNAVTCERDRGQWGNRYIACSVIGGSWTCNQVLTSDTSGKFRITRTGTNMKCYYYSGGWVQLGSYTLSSSPVQTKLVMNSLSGYPNLTQFDNFIVNNGETAADASGNNNNGTIYGAAWTSAGKFGNALQFDGVDDYVNTGAVSSLNVTTPVTMVAWIKSDSSATYRTILSKTSNSAVPIQWQLNINNDNKLMWYARHQQGSDDASPIIVSNNIAADGSWHHVAVVYSTITGEAKLYIDGALDNSATLTSGNIVSADREPQIGDVYYTSRANYFNGTMDELAIWNRALSANEILALYQNYHPSGIWNAAFDANSTANWNAINWGGDLNYGGELAAGANTKLLMHLNEGSGGTANDASGNGNNGTLFNGATWSSPGRFGNALQFDGTDDYVKFSASNMPTGERTVELWFYTGDTTASRQLFGYGGNNNSPACSSFLIHLSADKKSIYVGRHYPGCEVLAYSAGSAMANAWNHLAFTANAGGSRLYVNGQLVVSNSVVISTYVSGKDGFVGAMPGGGGIGTYVDPNYPYWKGNIDEVAVYNAALDANAILEHYRKGAANIRFRTRTASAQGALGGAEWSNQRELDSNSDINGLWHFNEGSGSTANDSSGNGNNGTLTNGPAWSSSGKFGNALQFDGVNDYVNIIKSDEFHFGTSSFAVAAWVNFSALTGVQNILAFYVVTNNALQFAWNTNHFTIWGETSTVLDTTGFSPALNTWYHVAFVRNGNVWNIYVNGTSYANAVDTRTLNYPKDNVGIGLLPTSLQYFNGKIDEVAIWNRALGANEVLGLYRRGQYYASGQGAIASDSNRFIEVQALLETENAAYTPVLQDLNISCS